jgi:hypothetical protein
LAAHVLLVRQVCSAVKWRCGCAQSATATTAHCAPASASAFAALLACAAPASASASASLIASASAACAAHESGSTLHGKLVSGISGKGGRASAGTFVSGYAANPAGKRVSKMRIRRVCAADELQNLV